MYTLHVCAGGVTSCTIAADEYVTIQYDEDNRLFYTCISKLLWLMRKFIKDICMQYLENLHIIKVQNNNAWCIQTCPNFLLIRIDLITSVVRSHLPTNATFFGRSCSYKLRQSAPCRGLKIASISAYPFSVNIVSYSIAYKDAQMSR